MPKADIGDAEIHYEEHGKGEPLMLVSGLGGTGTYWKANLPALSVPLGASGGLPTGVQLVGRRWREDTLLDAGEIIEANVRWQWPPVAVT